MIYIKLGYKKSRNEQDYKEKYERNSLKENGIEKQKGIACALCVHEINKEKKK